MHRYGSVRGLAVRVDAGQLLICRVRFHDLATRFCRDFKRVCEPEQDSWGSRASEEPKFKVKDATFVSVAHVFLARRLLLPSRAAASPI
jgi:hypothetical protein